MHIYWFKDSKTGHLKQVDALLNELKKDSKFLLTHVDCLDKKFSLENIECIFAEPPKTNQKIVLIGAGHGVYENILNSKKFLIKNFNTQAIAIAILRPSKKLKSFDMVCAPKHDFGNKTLPKNVFNFLHLNHKDGLKVVSDPRINFVSFTGSVKAGYEVQKATHTKFIDMALELGGKDPAYARYDCDLEKTVENLVDGSFFNSGQSCCGIERIYVDEKIYDKFLESFVSKTYNYNFGNPLKKETNLGPVVKLSSAEFIINQMNSAINKGATKMIDDNKFNYPKEHKNYLIPQILTNVNHDMNFMTEETFGPCVGIMKVKNENEAIKLMNDSPYGLTASIWTKDIEIAEKIGNQVETGTFYMNRCDYLDPALSWTGVKETGKGCSLSEVAYEKLTAPKSFHLRKEQ